MDASKAEYSAARWDNGLVALMGETRAVTRDACWVGLKADSMEATTAVSRGATWVAQMDASMAVCWAAPKVAMRVAKMGER